MAMMQGDSYNLGIRILNNAGSPVTKADVEDVEITIGSLRKTYRNGQLQFFENLWLFPVFQAESFGCTPAAMKAQVRVKWKNGVIEGVPLYGVTLQESISKEVL